MTGKTKLSVFTLCMMTVAAVVSLRGLPMMAKEGLSLIFYILFSTIMFLIPASLVAADKDAAVAILDGDGEINALETEIDDIALSILVRTQAVAGDLRLVVGALRIINDLERIGDESAVMAERVVLADAGECAVIGEINESLFALAQKCMRQASHAFKEGDVEAAIRLCKASADIAQAEVGVVREVINRMAGCDGAITPEVAIHSIIVCRSLIRICRRAVNLAEHTFFIRTGGNLKHADLTKLAEERRET